MADTIRERLIRALREASGVGYVAPAALDALLPVVESIAAEARREEHAAGTTVLADLLRLTYSVQRDAYPSRAARAESERVTNAFRARINQHCSERNRSRAASLRAALAAMPPADEALRERVSGWIDEAPEHTAGLDLLRQIVTEPEDGSS